MMNDNFRITSLLAKQYLDNCIRHWRKQKRDGNKTAKYYIDAYQSCRLSLFGELLPLEDK